MEKIMYRIKGVTKWYDSGKKKTEALREINFDIRKNEFVAILGASGCGKSTLLRMLAGFLEPTTGTIYAGDHPILGPGPGVPVVYIFPVAERPEERRVRAQGTRQEQSGARADRDAVSEGCRAFGL